MVTPTTSLLILSPHHQHPLPNFLKKTPAQRLKMAIFSVVGHLSIVKRWAQSSLNRLCPLAELLLFTMASPDLPS
jgi:hypothetical protein